MAQTYVPYVDAVEQVAPEEAETFDKITAVMSKGAQTTYEQEGRAYRASHAKAHALAKGRLQVADGLPAELRQGLFAQPRSYDVAVRLAHVPGELLDDRKVSTPRGFAMKVYDVDGPMVAADASSSGTSQAQTQDWLLDTGEVFIASDAKTFLSQITMTEASVPMPQGVQAVVSAVSRAQNVVLNAVGLNSANMDFYGHPKLDPLTETYYSQAPLRYGSYIAKLRVRPVSPGFTQERPVEIHDENGLRTAVTGVLRTTPMEFAVEIQLCTDLDAMPVEDAHAKWSQDESPYREVARISIPAQDAWSAESREADERLSFCPSHSLAAHRPLGSIMRARMHIYELMAARRLQANSLAAGASTSRATASAGSGI